MQPHLRSAFDTPNKAHLLPNCYGPCISLHFCVDAAGTETNIMITLYEKMGFVTAGYLIALFGVDFFILVILKILLKREVDEVFQRMSEIRLKGVSRYIGWVERFFILTLVLVGSYAGIGFVLAAKSILRFGREEKFIEYVLLGTMLSFSLALVIGLFLRYLLGLHVFQ